jgi:hypothetical protein
MRSCGVVTQSVKSKQPSGSKSFTGNRTQWQAHKRMRTTTK